MQLAVLFAVWPYAAFAILVLGFAGRWFLLRRHPATESQPLPAPGHFARRMIWILLIAAHAVGILMPGAVLAWNVVAWRLYALEGIAFAIGLGALATCAMALWPGRSRAEQGDRKLGRAIYPGSLRSAATEITDATFASVLLTGVVTGLLLAGLYRWGSSWGAVTLTPYVASLSQGAPETAFIADMPFLVRLHVFTAFGAMALFPFTSAALAAMLAAQRVLTLRGVPSAVKRWRSRRT